MKNSSYTEKNERIPDNAEGDIKIAYICLCHMDPDFVAHTAKTLQYKDDGFFIHVDKKVDITPFYEKCKDIKNVYFVNEDKRVKNYWGGFNSIVATFNTIELAMSTDYYDRFVLLQGQDYPLYSNEYIHAFFAKHRNIEFNKAHNISISKVKRYYTKIGCYWHMDKKNMFYNILHKFNTLGIKYRPTRFVSKNCLWDIYHSWASFALTNECVCYCLNVYKNNTNFNRYMKHRFPPDEIYIATIIYNSKYKDRIYEKTVYNRSGDPTYLNLTYFEYPNIVITFTEASDYDWLKNTGCLYVRKLNSASQSLIKRIDDEIGTQK